MTDSPDDMDKRYLHPRGFKLEKRAKARVGGTISSLGSQHICSLSAKNQHGVLVGTYVKPPPTPSVAKLNDDAARATAQKYYVPTWTAAPNGCPAVSVTKIEDKNALTKYRPDQDQSGPPYAMHGKGKPGKGEPGKEVIPYVNTDHVFEVKFLRQFFNHIVDQGISANAFSCNTFNDFFWETPRQNSFNSMERSRLEFIWHLLPSNEFPDVAGVDSALNKNKGDLLNLELSQGIGNLQQGFTSDHQKLQFLHMLGGAISYANRPEVANLFRQTNQRLYDAFRTIDELLVQAKACGQAAPTLGGESSWADAFSTYMTDRLQSQNKIASLTINSIVSSNYFEVTTKDGGGLNSIGQGQQKVSEILRWS